MAAAKHGPADAGDATKPAAQPEAGPVKPADAGDATALSRLEAANSEAATLRAQLKAAQGDHARTKDDLVTVRAQLRGARDEAAELRARLDKGAISALPDLGNGAYELTRSVTIPDVNGARIDARKGDVVTDDETAALQETLGKVARVYRVNGATLNELLAMGALRDS